MELPEINVAQIIESSKEEIKTKVLEQTKETLARQISWSLESEIKEHVGIFVKEEILPELQASLLEQKQVILQGVADGLSQVGVELSKALIAKAVENLGSSWKAGDIAKKLFD